MKLEDFIVKYAKYSTSAKRSGIFPSVSLSIAYLESNRANGISLLAKNYNNFHGIQTYPKFKGTAVPLRDNQKGDYRYFATFRSVQSGFDGFVQFLQLNPRYAKAGVFTAKTPVEQITRIAQAGYSESPDWAKLVIKIDKFNKTKDFQDLDPLEVISFCFIIGTVLFLPSNYK